ncbi:signal peptidase I [Paenalkalicoccus suaedae]|uniref:Signal peptidase I n=1 Tax=Paenalkalicoccus suaedae TaxID=2592382 RepID=A0A859FEE0_9BACI|nr:signal peptidase I [Paenalkalicoccus suaedae]QKS71457.1 signal peptidase I [Paenalkalicoccus suaedae]
MITSRETFEWMKVIMIALVLAFLLRQFFFAPIVVDGQSMMPTLGDRDRMIVNKIGYTVDSPDRFDIIVFHAEVDKDYIKRIIGLPGDHIAYRNDTLYINGEPFDEPYLDAYKEEAAFLPLTIDFELEDVSLYDRVPPGHYFVMGDNRQYSKDSRHIDVVEESEIVGQANVIFWPVDELRVVN